MKRSGLISLICSLVAVMVLCLSIVLVLIFTDVIRVVPEELIISSASASGTYDGEALTDQNWSLMKGELKKGHRLSVVVSGSQTNVGVSENYVFATVLDDNGADVTEDYKIEYRPGALNVKARDITLTADSKMKVYDGEPLTANGFNIESPISLVSSHVIDAIVEGTITDLGKTDNIITSVVIKNSKGDDVTKNYKIKTKPGTLAIYSEDALVFETQSDVDEYTGLPLTNSNWKLASGKLMSGDRIVATVDGTQTSVGTSDNTISVVIMNGMGEDVTSTYEIVYNLGELTVIPKKITIKAGGAQKVYDGSPLRCTDYTVLPNCVDKSQITLDIKGSQTEVGSSDNVPSNAIIRDENGKDITSNYDITYENGTLDVVGSESELKPELSFKSFGSEKTYDGEPLVNSKWKLIEGQLKDGHILNVSVTGTITDAGETDNTFSVDILDASNNDVSGEYFIKTEFGELKVNKAVITVTADDASKVFDGQPLTKGTYRLSEPSYDEKFSFNVGVVGEQTDIGSSPNTVASCNVIDKDNNNVTQNFEIKKVEGVLKVVATEEELKPTLVYKSGSSEKAYDGTPLANNECDRISGELLDGHTEIIEITETLTEAGEKANTFKVTILDGETDVTDQYNVVCEPGTLEVTPVEIKITAASAKKTYDGSALKNDSYEVSPPNAILPEHNLDVEIVGNITVPSISGNSIANYFITDADGNDVSKNYKVEIENGTLEVVKIYFKVVSRGAEKYYDGTPLTNDAYDLYPQDALLRGHEEVVTITGTNTVPGDAPNTIADVRVVDADQNDVTSFYEIETENGTLTVKSEAIVITAKDQWKFYDGQPLVASEFTVSPPEILDEMEFVVEFSGEVTFPGAKVDSIITGYTVYDKDGNDITANLDITTVNGSLEIKKTPITITSKGATKEYDGTPLTNNGEGGYEIESEGIIPENYDISVIMKAGITDPGDMPNTIDSVIITDENGVDVSEYYVITREEEFLHVTKKVLSITAPTITRLYNGEVLEARECTYEYGSEPLSNHTVNVDVVGSIILPGTVDNVITGYTVVDDTGRDVTYCYEIIATNGTLTVTPIKITIVSASDSKLYDGEPLTNSNYEIIPADAPLPTHTVIVKVTGSIINHGSVKNTISPVEIVDEEGNHVEEAYEITLLPGDLIISQHKIAIIAGSAEKLYDGLPLKCEDFEFKVYEGYFPDDYVVEVEISGEITIPSTAVNKIVSWTIWDKDGNDKTQLYSVDAINGTLTVFTASITVAADDAEKFYDGEPLTNSGYKVISATPLPEDLIVEATVEGSITDPGTEYNVVTSVVIKRYGKDVTSGFDVTLESGELLVKKIPITIKSAYAVKEYDGEPLAKDEIEVIGEENIFDNHTLSVDVTGEITEPGWVYNEFTYGITDENGTSVRKYYEVSESFGKLYVDRIKVTVVSNSAEKFWDGTPLTDDGYKITFGKVLEEHTLDVEISGIATVPGREPNTISNVSISNDYGDDVKEKYYEVRAVEGELLIYSSEFTVVAKSDSKAYDGTPLTNSNYEVFGELPEGYTYDVTVEGSVTDIATVENNVSVIIYDALGNDVTDRIDVECIPGTLRVYQRNIMIRANSDSKEYDGAPLRNSGYCTESGSDSLLPGHTMSATVEGSRTDPGDTDNVITDVSITDEVGNDVSQYYNVTCFKGNLTIDKISLRIESETDSKYYDGEPLVNSGYQVDTEDKILPDHTLYVEVNGSIIVPGVVDNTMTVYIIDAEGNDVKDLYYEVTEVLGTLSVEAITITVTSDDATKQYDGQPLTKSSYKVRGTVPDGYELIVVVDGALTDIDEVPNTISQCLLLDENGHPVSGEYINVVAVAGTLRVTKRNLIIRSKNATKEYDGTPLTDPTFTTSPSNALLDGHTALADVTGTVTKVSSVNNTIENARVVDENGADVSHFYDITTIEGTLTVVEKIVYFTLENGKANEQLHLKTESYGDYNKDTNTWEVAPEYDKLTVDGYSAYHLFSIALQEYSDDSSLKTVDITPKYGIFALPYHTYTDNSTNRQTSDTRISGNTNRKYSVDYYTWNGVDKISLPGQENIDYEREYRAFVYDNYLYVDGETRDFMELFIEEKSKMIDPNASREELILSVANCIKISAKYNANYNAELELEDNVIIAFLDEYKEGVCRHYAAAATMLFRTLGIPARYTVGFAATIGSSGKADVTSDDAHAWVEVYIDGLGWEVVEVTGSDEPRKFTVTPTSVSKKYDGTTLYPINAVSGLSELTNEGYTYAVTVEGENSALGITKSRVTQLQIFDPFGELVYDKLANIGKDMFKITYREGELNNYIAKLTFTSESHKKQYDGTPLVVTEEDCKYVPGADAISAGHTYKFIPEATLTEVGVVSSNFSVKMYDENGADVSKYYVISYTHGTLQITPRELTVKAKDANKVYDGKPLKCQEIEYDASLLAEGDYISNFTIDGEKTIIGESANVITKVVIKNKNGKDVTQCYNLKFIDGKLTVTES